MGATVPDLEDYRRLFDDAVVGMFRATPAGRIVAVNRAGARLVGFASPREMLTSVTDWRPLYVDPERRAAFDQALREHGSVSRFEAEVYRKDRSRIWISVSARAVRAGQEGIRYYDGIVEDVTEYRQLETELRRRNELLQTIFDHMPCMFNVLGPGARPLMVNREWTRVLGWTAEELEGRDLLTLLYPSAEERRRAQAFVAAADRRWEDFRLRVRAGGLVARSPQAVVGYRPFPGTNSGMIRPELALGFAAVFRHPASCRSSHVAA
jgi:PAS domain S-box-containing protein